LPKLLELCLKPGQLCINFFQNEIHERLAPRLIETESYYIYTNYARISLKVSL
jgi:hypothetical protein